MGKKCNFKIVKLIYFLGKNKLFVFSMWKLTLGYRYLSNVQACGYINTMIVLELV
jgi:hypothetical protein